MLEAGLKTLGLAASGHQTDQLLAYLRLLQKWNRVYNLTAVRDVREMVNLHLLDSLAVLPHLHGSRILDVGSGAGLPGIPLAVFSPQREFVLLDANGKKARFMRQAVIDLGLRNVVVEQARTESYHPAEGFDTVISRAFASVADFVRGAGSHCREGGRLLAMKGRYPDTELEALPTSYRVVDVHALDIPGLTSQRHLIEIARG